MSQFLLCILLAQASAAVDADYVLRGATIYDGSADAGKVGDLAIKGERIVGIGTFEVKGNPKIFDCTGMVLTAGFIDLHTHSDSAMTKAATSLNLNYLQQGCTTIVTGNCGFGPADVAEYFQQMEKVGVGTNVIHQCPHNAIRAKVMGNVNRDPTPKELKAMEALVDKGMRDGAFGLATGLIYNPGTYSKTPELIALAKVAAKHGGLYASHIRDENVNIFSALEEVLAIAKKAGIRVHVSHIKVSGMSVWGKSPDVIGLIKAAQKAGVAITADQYPYVASSTNLAAMTIPTKYREGDAKDLIKKFDDPDEGPKLREEIAKKIDARNGGASMKIASFPPRTDWQGKSLDEIAALEKTAVVDLVIDIQKKGGASIVSFGMHEEDVRLFMKQSFVATASDGSSMLPSTTVPHPRSYGTFPRKIGKYALEDKIVSLEQALRSSNGLPADILKLPERGYLKTGYFADVVVFDPKTFRDQATYEKPHQYAVGMKYVFVNGKLVLDEGKATNVRAGKVLRHVPANKKLASRYPLEYPPALKTVVTETTPDFLKPGPNLREGVAIAKTPPTVDFAFYPEQNYPGNPWSCRSDGIVVGDVYYSSDNDHLAPRGTAHLWEYHATQKKFRLLCDTVKFLESVKAFPPDMNYRPGEMQSRIDLGSDGWLYYATDRGSPTVTHDANGYKGEWILRTNPKTLETQIVATHPIAKHTLPASILDPERMIYYGGTAPGKDSPNQKIQFFAFDVKKRKMLIVADDGPSRTLFLSPSTGRVFWEGKMYDPATNTISPANVPHVRSATRETPQGIVYGTSHTKADLWAYHVKTNELKQLGTAAVGNQEYIASIDADPTGRYLYYIPGAHGGAVGDGAPVVQWDTQTGTRKVLAFLHQTFWDKHGYALDGSFGSALDEKGERLFISWDGWRRGQPRGWESAALTVVHIPASERTVEK